MLPALMALLAAAAPVPDRTCATHAEPPQRDFRPRAQDVVVGRVVFLGLDGTPGMGRPLHGDPTMKVGVLVKAGAPVTVRLQARGATRARLDYDQATSRGDDRSVAAGDGQRAIRFVPCPPQTTAFTDGEPLGPWTGYPGGFLVARPGCAVLEAAGVRRRVALGVAARRCHATS